MAEPKCTDCGWRAKYDKHPTSFLGRLWKFHTKFCPGWKGYLRTLSEEERQDIYKRYKMKPRKL
jgi:hypothetical protein